HLHEDGYYYTEGQTPFFPDPGMLQIRVGKGIEYDVVNDTVWITGDTTFTRSLSRLIDMKTFGWYSGDCHLHINHTGGFYGLNTLGLHRVARAEDLNVSYGLDNGYFFTGAVDPSSTAEQLVYMSEEYRSDTYGHVDLLGLTSLVSPTFSRWMPMLIDVADSARAQGALVVLAHPVPTSDPFDVTNWPGTGYARELPIGLLHGAYDAFEVMCYSNAPGNGIELPTWYHALNLGFRIPPVAGTDSAINRLADAPAGGYRTYAYLGTDSLTVPNWNAAVDSGRTFVTNGPLFTDFRVNGALPGDSLVTPGTPLALLVEISLFSRLPVDRLELVVNGIVERTVEPAGPFTSLDTTLAFTANESAWIAARVSGVESDWHVIGDTLFAHTAPVYVSIGNDPVTDMAAANFFLDRLNDFRTVVITEGEFESAQDSLRVTAEIENALVYYGAFTATGVEADAGASIPAPLPLSLRAAPNPFRDGTGIILDVPATKSGIPALLDVRVLDIRGRAVRTLCHEYRPPGSVAFAWDGRGADGRRAPSGVYLVRATFLGRNETTRVVLVR
ncbi:MAG: CehA/McbA family metallohydrolase, partial [Gemmatimonadetes bacterium]|nr:CehA/McbA family metallohydrolase [Gemmatimonadota bacterium]